MKIFTYSWVRLGEESETGYERASRGLDKLAS